MRPANPAILLLAAGLVVAATVVAVFPARSQPNQFIIQNADDSSTYALVDSPGLGALIATVPPRFVIASANENKFVVMEPAPAALMALIGQVQDRFILRHANENRFFQLGYPLDLIDDNNPPLVGEVAARTAGEDSIRITWTTNEFTTSQFEWGDQPGNYPNLVADTLYRTLHEVTLTGILPGVTYYYRITSTDRSGNSVQSPEYTYKATTPIFLPMVVRLVNR